MCNDFNLEIVKPPKSPSSSLKYPYLFFKGTAYLLVLSINDITLTLELKDGVIAENAETGQDFVDRRHLQHLPSADILYIGKD